LSEVVRAKKKIRDAGIPCRVPERNEMPERLATGRWDAAEDAYRQAVALATNDPERRFLTGRLQEVRNARLA
jgi:predicted RNA polymerase sigma factor